MANGGPYEGLQEIEVDLVNDPGGALYERFRGDFESQFGGMYNQDLANRSFQELWSSFSGIGDFQSGLRGDLISPEEMSQFMLNRERTVAPQVARNRARASSEAGRRLGSRSGATSRAVYNQVDVPAQFASSEFASNLYNMNIQSRDSREREAELNEMRAKMFGAQGQAGLLGGLSGGNQAFAQMMNQLMQARFGVEAARAGREDSGFGFSDIVDIGTRVIPLL
ncbi:MAG: hypothetical protein KAR42_17650 [candidate division Zixibacteria bacterium]|nr:hypothetical protein [candidate division Zixibacteria bacterium]